MIIDLHYLPSTEYFARILEHDEIVFEIHEFYQKQSYRNRCEILTSNKIDVLSIPVKQGNSKILVKDVKIDYSQDWVRRHWGAIYSGYGKSPFFEFYSDYFKNIFNKKTDFLVDFNVEMLSICLKFLKVEKKISFSENYKAHLENDFRGQIHPKRIFSEESTYRAKEYRQNFGNEFEPNLSILDLMFCQGNQAKKILQDSIIK